MNYSTSDYLTQLEQDREDLVDNLETKGITGLTGDETFTELVPEVLNISGGGGASDYFNLTVSGWSSASVSKCMYRVPKFTISGISRLDGFFSNLQSITSIDLTGFDTQQTEYMNDMFFNCSNLTTLDVSTFDVSGVYEMANMFCNCSSLTSLDLSNWNTSNCSNVISMFEGCSDLQTLTLSNNFTGTTITDTSYMFSGCSSLTSLDLSMLDARYIETTTGMFSGCSSLVDLDISSMDFGSIVDYSEMFTDMPNNAVVKVKDVNAQDFILNTLSSGDDRPSAWTTSNVVIAD